MFVERLTAALERESSTFTALNMAIAEEQERTQTLHDRARLQQEELTQLGMAETHVISNHDNIQ